MEITKEILESILDAYSYEIVFVDRQHIVRYMNKTAKERYGERVKINQSLFNCHSENSKVKIEEFLKRADAGEDEMFETYNTKTEDIKTESNIVKQNVNTVETEDDSFWD